MPSSNAPINKLLSINELAERLSIKPNTLRQMVRDGRVPAYKVGRVYRFDPARVTEWLQKLEVQSSPAEEVTWLPK